MFSNIGRKIKTLAIAIFVIEVIASIIIGITMISTGEKMHYEGDGLKIFGFIILFLGWFVAWISSFCMYGFGELIDKTSSIEQKLSTLLPQNKKMSDHLQTSESSTSVSSDIEAKNNSKSDNPPATKENNLKNDHEDSPLKSAISMLFNSSDNQ